MGKPCDAMSDGEIAALFRDAKDKAEERKILAELNLTTVGEIDRILEAQGFDLQKLLPRKRKPTPKQEAYWKNARNRALPGMLDVKRAQELYGEGMKDQDIADSLGVSPACVGNWRRKNRLPPIKKGALKMKKEDTATMESSESLTTGACGPTISAERLGSLLTQAAQICPDVAMNGSVDTCRSVEISIRYDADGNARSAVVNLLK